MVAKIVIDVHSHVRHADSAESERKVEHIISDLGFNVGYNYKATSDYVAKIAELCPTGVDAYFDNVGGVQTDSVFPNFNLGPESQSVVKSLNIILKRQRSVRAYCHPSSVSDSA